MDLGLGEKLAPAFRTPRRPEAYATLDLREQSRQLGSCSLWRLRFFCIPRGSIISREV